MSEKIKSYIEIEIKADNFGKIIQFVTDEEEKRYFIKIEITKDKYEEIKKKIKEAKGEK